VFPVSILQTHDGMTGYRNTPDNPKSDPRDRDAAEDAPETPTDEPPPVLVHDPPVDEPRAPYTVRRDDVADPGE
jgi:hypothetical protein